LNGVRLIGVVIVIVIEFSEFYVDIV